MYSFFLYLFILIYSTTLVWLSEHAKNATNKKIFMFLAFLLVFLPSAIRYGVGTDFFHYYDIFNYQDLFTKNEYGFYLINDVIRFLNLSVQWAIAAYSFVFTFVAFLSYPKRNAWIYHILFMAMLMFFSFNGIRQAISVVFIMLAIKYELENRTFILFILVFVASLFHQSAIFLVPAILFSKIPLSYKIKEVVFPLIITGVTAFIWLGASTFSIAENIAVKLDLPYQHYFESSYFETANINTGYLVLTKVLFALILLLNSSKLLRVSENNWPIIVYTGFFIVFYSLASQSAAFGRLSYVYTPGVIYFLYLFISNYSKKSNTWFFFTFLTFFAYVLPYVTTSLSTINNPNNDNSYQTIFNKRF